MKQQTFVSFGDQRDYWPLAHPGDDPLLPLGLDSHRYRCCGNGVVSNVAQAIGQALADEIAREPAA